jgi:putative flippase GtrA
MALASPNDALIEAPFVATIGARILPQLSRYSAVSVIALAIDFGVYIALVRLAVNVPVAGVIGYAMGMLTHYILSSAFVFDVARSQKSARRRLVEFAASGLLGLMLTVAVIASLTDYFAAPPIAAKVVAAVVSFLAVFLVRRCIVFAPPSNEKESGGHLVYPKSVSCR